MDRQVARVTGQQGVTAMGQLRNGLVCASALVALAGAAVAAQGGGRALFGASAAEAATAQGGGQGDPQVVGSEDELVIVALSLV